MPRVRRAAVVRARGPAALLGALLAFDACGREKVIGDEPDGGAGFVPGPICVWHGQDPAENPAQNPAIDPCLWKSVAIRGGGFVSGLTFSPVVRDVVYARTDIGGAYRWDVASGRWVALLDWVDRSRINLIGVESIVADPVEPDVVYVAAGTYLTGGNGAILRSADRGRTFAVHDVSFPMGGNHNGRSMGERLAVDPNQPSRLYFASRTRGLWQSTTSGATWTEVAAFPATATGAESIGLAFVLFDGRGGTPGTETSVVYVGVGGTGAGSNLFLSTDAGASFSEVPGGPTAMMPHHAAIDANGVVFLTYNNGPGPNDITAGAVWTFSPGSGAWADVTPERSAHGYGGVTVDRARPGTVMVTTIDWWAPDEIYRSVNSGASWRPLGPRAVRDVAGARYLFFGRPTPTATGWMGDIEIDPFDSARALYITGQGIWRSDDVVRADSGGATHWSFRNEGLEETVALDLVSPPAGAPLLSAVGDLAGFRHDDLDAPVPAGMFRHPISQNTNSIDFAESDPSFVVRVGRATAGTTERRGAYSTNGGTTWTPFPSEPDGSTGEGAVAVSADGSTLLWMTRGKPPARSTDRGQTWAWSVGVPANARPVSDRVNPSKFYAFSARRILVSSDAGASFAMTDVELPAGRGLLRPAFGAEGDLWLAMTAGLFHSTDAGASFVQIPVVEESYAVGFGQAAPGATYPALYQSARIDGVVGVFRSIDGAASWTRINDALHQFGQINVISGDPRRFGRVYLGTAGRGIIYGDPP